ncbi:MAG: hypothetical protein QXY99_05150, partial [Thermoproteota archaeon]
MEAKKNNDNKIDHVITKDFRKMGFEDILTKEAFVSLPMRIRTALVVRLGMYAGFLLKRVIFLTEKNPPDVLYVWYRFFAVRTIVLNRLRTFKFSV